MKILLIILLVLNAFLGSASAQTITPQGRLTLTSGSPVMSVDVTAATTVYYACYAGNVVPVGASPTNLTISACQVSMGLSTSNVLSGSLYDVYAINNGGSLAICAGPAWTSTTSRGSGAGTAEVNQTNGGLWTNANSLTNCYGGGAGSTDYGPISTNAGTLLGTLYATANGQTAVQITPAAAAGGSANVVGLYNAYNRVLVRSSNQDSTASWTIASATWRAANNSNSNRITYVDGLGQSQVSASYVVGCQPPINNACVVGVNFDATTGAPPGILGYVFNPNQTGVTVDHQLAGGATNIALGLHYAQAMEARGFGAGTISFFGGGRTGLTVSYLY